VLEDRRGDRRDDTYGHSLAARHVHRLPLGGDLRLTGGVCPTRGIPTLRHITPTVDKANLTFGAEGSVDALLATAAEAPTQRSRVQERRATAAADRTPML
jgi:hypothetical protein